MKRIAVSLLGLVFLATPDLHSQGSSPVELETRAERTAFRETSRYVDVMEFVQQVAAASPRIRLTTFGYSYEGRALPLVVVGDVADTGPEAVRNSGKLRVFVQANIHAGEVCGKEAVLMLLRAMANGTHAEWLDSLVLLVAPIYNVDGNERIGLKNRPRQHGPVGGMGRRANAQDLDLNRDHMKLESPEARSLVGLMNRYDPHVLVDLHTTNGTHHAYHLTYSPPLNPNTPVSINRFLREQLLPAVTRAVKDRHGWDYYYYGNLPWRSSTAERGWYTFDHRPRFNNNYIGLRNRIGILGEAYAYATFQERTIAQLWFVEAIVDYVHRHTSTVRRVVAESEATQVAGTAYALRASFERSRDSVEVLLGEVIEERHPYTGDVMLRRADARRAERMPEFGTFRATETVVAPLAYLVPATLTRVLAMLDDHGIEWAAARVPTSAVLERFVIDSSSVAERAFQGHRVRTLFGAYERLEESPSAPMVRVPVEQPLGRLAVYLLEPRSDDGLVHWNVLDREIEGSSDYPILREVRR